MRSSPPASRSIVFEEPAVASADLRGGAPGTRETDLLAPDETVERVDAIVLSGGSAFGLDAPGGVQAWLREQGRGFALGPVRRADRARRDPVRSASMAATRTGAAFRPIASSAMRRRPMPASTSRSAPPAPDYGATTVNLKGGLGSASAHDARRRNRRRDRRRQCGRQRHRSATARISGRRRSSRTASSADSAARRRFRPTRSPSALKGGVRENTTIALVATDATLTKAQAKRLAMMAHDGLARAIYPVHTPLDGDIVFAASTGKQPAPDPIGFRRTRRASPPMCWPRAVARGVYEATALPFPGALPSWRDKFGG